MTSFSALDAKNRFGEVLTAAQHEPVTIEKHGKPVAVVISKAAYDEFRAAKLEMLRVPQSLGTA